MASAQTLVPWSDIALSVVGCHSPNALSRLPAVSSPVCSNPLSIPVMASFAFVLCRCRAAIEFGHCLPVLYVVTGILLLR